MPFYLKSLPAVNSKQILTNNFAVTKIRCTIAKKPILHIVPRSLQQQYRKL